MIKTLIFDLGNVVLRFDHYIICRRFSRISGHREEELYTLFFRSSLDRPFNEGKESGEAFLMKINKRLNLTLGIEEFKAIWNDMFFPPEREMEGLLLGLKRTHNLYLLSNTNVFHFEYLLSKYRILDVFNEHILSYKVGYTKPSEEIYLEALRRSGSMPHECIFIDDIEEYVDAAISLGMKGIHFKGIDQLKEGLRRYGVL